MTAFFDQIFKTKTESDRERTRFYVIILEVKLFSKFRIHKFITVPENVILIHSSSPRSMLPSSLIMTLILELRRSLLDSLDETWVGASVVEVIAVVGALNCF